MLRSSADALATAAATVDADVFAAVVDALTQARHVLVVGVGTSAPPAQNCAYRFRSIGLLAEAPPDILVQHVSAALLRRDAACLAVSHTGQTRETLAAITSARDAGAAAIGITSFHRSPLTEVCDHSPVAGSHETKPATTSKPEPAGSCTAPSSTPSPGTAPTSPTPRPDRPPIVAEHRL